MYRWICFLFFGTGQFSTFTVFFPVTVVHSSLNREERQHPKAPPVLSMDFHTLDLSGVKVSNVKYPK